MARYAGFLILGNWKAQLTSCPCRTTGLCPLVLRSTQPRDWCQSQPRFANVQSSPAVVRYALRMTALIVRPIYGRIEVRGLRAPRGEEPSNKSMFKTAAGAAIRPTWVDAADGEPGWKGYWTIAREHLTEVAESIAIRNGSVDIEMHYSETEKCDLRCRKAQGDDCTCSCEGKHHGKGQHASWMEVGESTLVRGGGAKVVTRVLTREQAKQDRRDRDVEIFRARGWTTS